MKPAQVEAIVNAVAEAAHERARAMLCSNDTNALRIRVDAMETLMERLTDALLAGTSADPEQQKAPAAKKGSK